MEDPTTFEEQTRSQSLKFLCTLTFIYSGIVGFIFLCTMIFIKPFLKYIDENYEAVTSKMNETQIQQLQLINSMGAGKVIIACGVFLLVLGLSFFGALQMWHNKYKGFIMYVIANILLSVLAFNIVFLILNTLFIFLYFRQSKALEK